MKGRAIRIGGAVGYWGDTASGARTLVQSGDIDYMICDYLAEITMSILARAHGRDANAGYAVDFVGKILTPLLPEIARRGIKVIANAGGVNVEACRHAIRKACDDAGVSLKIGTVEGNDLLTRATEFEAAGMREMDTDAGWPSEVVSINAYLGAFPVAAALQEGADIVITGRCVDSALALGPLIHEFGWGREDFDRLAAGTLIGHLLECGAQATGGNFTDWELSADGWADMGFPIAECDADGNCTIGKPAGTGGLVSRLTVAEQMLYEIGDPATYIVPDVVADFSRVTLTEIGRDQVRVEGARGRPPTESYKVTVTHVDGFRTFGQFALVGIEAGRKAEHYADALITKAETRLAEEGLGGFRQLAVHVIGPESIYGETARIDARETREVLLRIDVHHDEREALEIFADEFMGSGLAMAPGRSGWFGGRPRPTPVIRLFSFLLPKDDVPVSVQVDGRPAMADLRPVNGFEPAPAERPFTENDELEDLAGETERVPLVAFAVARSGDKGDKANIGVIARRPEFLPLIRANLTPEAVRAYFAHLVEGDVERFDVPGIHALNFLLHEALDGGGIASLQLDPQAKAWAQMLLDYEIEVPASWVAA